MAHDVLESHIRGPLIFTKFVTTIKGYNLNNKDKVNKLIWKASEQYYAIKARACANRSMQKLYIPREEATSPTAATEAMMITGVIKAKQNRDVVTLDILNAFVQTRIPKSKDKIIIKICRDLVNILLETCPEVYDNYVFYKGKTNNNKIIYVKNLKALYRMLTASILYYKKFVNNFKTIGFELNLYNPCVAN